MKRLLRVISLLMVLFLNHIFAANPHWTTLVVGDSISWDFENENNHGFNLHCLIPATPAPDDAGWAGDESITGVGGDNGLPGAGVAWTIGAPNMFDGFDPAVTEESDCHIVDGILLYNNCNDPFGAAVTDPPYDFINGRGQSGYLGTYQLNQWGDGLHSETNDQIATSPTVLLNEGAELTVWAVGNTTASWAGVRIAPEFDPDPDPAQGYATGSGGIAILSADNHSLLASLLVAAEGCDVNVPKEFKLDLSAYAGQNVVIEVVDAFANGWGFLMVDEIKITNANLVTNVENNTTPPNEFHLAQNYPNPFNPSTLIEYSIPTSGFVTLKVYNELGQEVASLVNGFHQPGKYTVSFDGSGLSSGIYFYRMSSGNFTDSKKIMLLK